CFWNSYADFVSAGASYSKMPSVWMPAPTLPFKRGKVRRSSTLAALSGVAGSAANTSDAVHSVTATSGKPRDRRLLNEANIAGILEGYVALNREDECWANPLILTSFRVPPRPVLGTV